MQIVNFEGLDLSQFIHLWHHPIATFSWVGFECVLIEKLSLKIFFHCTGYIISRFGPFRLSISCKGPLLYNKYDIYILMWSSHMSKSIKIRCMGQQFLIQFLWDDIYTDHSCTISNKHLPKDMNVCGVIYWRFTFGYMRRSNGFIEQRVIDVYAIVFGRSLCVCVKPSSRESRSIFRILR